MIDWSLLPIFVPTFFFVSITPGMCMILALTLGITIGLRQSLWMMSGELLGVALVVTTTIMGMAAVMVKFSWLFSGIKIAGGIYLCST